MIGAYEFNYPGVALGGQAIVVADSLKQAVDLLLEHPATPSSVKAEDLSLERVTSLHTPKVIFNWNGDY